jgi:AcrR family transcriptional regulator
MAVKEMGTPPTRKRLTAEARREQLLDVTRAIVDESGFHAVSIEGVARRAGVSRPIVYGHFGDLGGLLEALVERENARALSQLATVLPVDPGVDDPAEALLTAFRGYLELVRADPVTWRLALMPPEGAPELLRRQVVQGRDAVVAVLAQLLGRGDSPATASPDPNLTARMITVIADESARLTLTDPANYPTERLLDHARWLLVRTARDRA